MKLPYGMPKAEGKPYELAKKVTELLVNSSVTYREAEDALTLAQDMLMDVKLKEARTLVDELADALEHLKLKIKH